jgi:hypothetical protein
MKNVLSNSINKEDYNFFVSPNHFFFALDRGWMEQNQKSFALKLPTGESLLFSERHVFEEITFDIDNYQFFESETGFKGAVDASFLSMESVVVEMFLPNGEIYNDLIADGYVCTDPDQHQYGRQLDNLIFEFMEFGPEGDNMHASTINMGDYTVDEILSQVSGYSNAAITQFINDKELFLLAECIHEHDTY